jgi:tetratricopeptide (TPR) repeat protein
MPFDEEYFASDEFQELLNSYETSEASGDTMFLDADDLVDIADYYNMQGSPEHALTAVKQGLELYPDHVLLNVFMARRALEEEDVEQAEQYADNIGDKDSPDYHYLRAEILIAQNRIDEADRYLRDYGMTVEADEYGDFVKDVANLYVDYDVSDKAYEWMLRSTSDNSDDFKELMGRALFGVGKYKDSQRMFNELLDNHPFSKQYWTALATAQYMDEDYNGSITSSEYAIAIDPNDPDGLLTKANGLMKLGNYEQAAEYFHRYSQTCPDDAMGPLHEAACMVNMGKNAEAVPLLEKAVGLPNSEDVLPQIYQELAFAYNAMGELDRALEAIDKTKKLECDHAEMMVIRGHLLLTHGLIDEAEDTFRKAM